MSAVATPGGQLSTLRAATADLRRELEAAEQRRQDVLSELQRTIAALDAVVALMASAGQSETL